MLIDYGLDPTDFFLEFIRISSFFPLKEGLFPIIL
jgi:hypothetical protein